MSTTTSKVSTWAIALIIALLAMNGYQWYNNSKLKSKSQLQAQEMYELEQVQAELDNDYQDALASIEGLRDNNEELGLLIDNQKQELQAQKDKINNLIWSKRELDKAREEIKKMSALAEGYVAEITTLKEENVRLYAQNQSLSEEKVVLTQNLEDEIKAKQELAEVKAILAVQNEELSKERSKLASMVDMGSAVKINFLQVTGHELKDDGKLKQKKKAKDIDVLRICFKTETNMVTPAGQEQFYIRYVDPQGETVAVEDLGSGVLTDKLTNSDVRYSTSGSIDYENQDTEGCIDWQLNHQLPKGQYGVEMYNKGFMVGKGNFLLK